MLKMPFVVCTSAILFMGHTANGISFQRDVMNVPAAGIPSYIYRQSRPCIWFPRGILYYDSAVIY